MVQSTGVANAQYLRSLLLGNEGENRSTADDDRLARWVKNMAGIFPMGCCSLVCDFSELNIITE